MKLKFLIGFYSNKEIIYLRFNKKIKEITLIEVDKI